MAQVFGFPFDRLPRVSRHEATLGNAVARWLGAQRTDGARVAALVGGAVTARLVGSAAEPAGHVARAVVSIEGVPLEVSVDGATARGVAQRLVGGPAEIAAARPLDATEQALWALVVAAALEDLGVAGSVVPVVDGEPRAAEDLETFELAVAGALAARVHVGVPRDLLLRVPPARPVPAWAAATELDVVVALGRCALPRAALRQLAPRDVITLEPPVGGRAELVIGAGGLGLRAAPGAVEAEVATGYVVRDMALPDDAHLELTVALGTTRLSVRALGELALGQVVALGRPLAGPFELRVEGRVIGRGELVDVDGELGVRVVSLGE